GTNREKMEVLEVGAALVNMNTITGYYEYSPISPFQFTIHSLSQPQSDFAKKNQVELYKLCNEMPPEANYAACRKALLSWFEGAGLVDRWSRNMVGKNVVTFDLDILHEVGILDKEDYH